eukprot:scaffold74704_cov30-Tisochrysis_lutea.AAC.4
MNDSRPCSSDAHDENWERDVSKVDTEALAKCFHHMPTNHSIWRIDQVAPCGSTALCAPRSLHHTMLASVASCSPEEAVLADLAAFAPSLCALPPLFAPGLAAAAASAMLARLRAGPAVVLSFVFTLDADVAARILLDSNPLSEADWARIACPDETPLAAKSSVSRGLCSLELPFVTAASESRSPAPRSRFRSL